MKNCKSLSNAPKQMYNHQKSFSNPKTEKTASGKRENLPLSVIKQIYDLSDFNSPNYIITINNFKEWIKVEYQKKGSIDMNILELLQQNARQKASAISDGVHFSVSAVIERIRKM